jgi:amidase
MDAARLCETLGHRVEEVRADLLNDPNIAVTFGSVFSCLAGYFVAYWEKELGRKIAQDELEPVTWAVYQAGLRRTGADFLIALEGVQRFSRKIAHWYHDGGYDLLLSPTMRIPPTQIGAFHWNPEDRRKWLEVTNAFVAFTRVQNMTGQPAMSMPLFWNKENVPIGVQFAGRFGDEATLFRLAGQLEQARNWARRTPPIHCSKK